MRRATIFLAVGVVAAFGVGITYRFTHALPGPTRVKLGQTFKVAKACSIKPRFVGGWGNVATVAVATDDDTLQTETRLQVGGYTSCNKGDGSSIRAIVEEITPDSVLFLFSPSPYN